MQQLRATCSHTMSSSTPSVSVVASFATHQPPQYRAIGVVLAIGSGVLIGSSFVFKKKGLLNSQRGAVAGEGVAYLKSPMWWTGMTLMILGELCNFAAYAFVEAIIVTPMGALSVVISSLLSHFILHEKLSLFGWISSFQCLLGAAILALNGPQEQSVSTIEGFKHLFVTPWFLAYGGVVLVVAAVLAFWVIPRWGKNSMLPCLGVCSLIGGLSVSCTQGLGTCIVTSIRGDNQFKNWFIYFLLVFVVLTLLTEIYYLNVALAMFNTAMVTPTYYVTFTFCTLVTSIILYQGLTATASQIITVVLAFAVICTGIFILQMSKVDPRSLTGVDERTTLLLEAARQETSPYVAQEVELQRGSTLRSRQSRRSHARTGSQPRSSGAPSEGATFTTPVDEAAVFSDFEDPIDFPLGVDDEKHAIVARSEEPGIDALRGTFGAIGTIIRARRCASVLSAAEAARSSASLHRVRSTSTHGSGGGGVGPWPKTLGARRAGSAFTTRVGSEAFAEPSAEKGEVHVDVVALARPALSGSRGRPNSASSGVPSAPYSASTSPLHFFGSEHLASLGLGGRARSGSSVRFEDEFERRPPSASGAGGYRCRRGTLQHCSGPGYRRENRLSVVRSEYTKQNSVFVYTRVCDILILL
ncbi:magnesium transporter NIPA-domain-containing protein [Amylocystis lapponica]|nr:magnesium transporter NIPA-domain-containing protein [Amylocystis lapponica]